MSTDRIKMYLSRADGEFEILPKERWEPRHKYLDRIDYKSNYSPDKREYMPNICVFRNDGEISVAAWQACPAKVLYGHNLQEVTQPELEAFLDKSVAQLAYAGILTDKEVLRNHYLSGVDVNKLALYYGTAVAPFRILQHTPTTGQFKRAVTLYPDDGICVYNTLKHRKLKFYDKTVQSQKLEFLPNDLAEFMKQVSFALINMEYSIEGKDQIDDELKIQKITLPNTLESFWNPIVSQTILKNRVLSFLNQIFTIDLTKREECFLAVQTYCKQHNIHGPQAMTSLWGSIERISTFGLNNFQNWLLESGDPKQARNFINRLKAIHLPCLPEEQMLKEIVYNALETMEPVTLETLKTTDEYLKKGLFPPKSGSNTKDVPTRPLLEWAGGLQ